MNVHVGTLTREKPPFRAEHIGSLLRPAQLLEQRARFSHGEISQDKLTEAEICYATVAMVTDFDCWHPDHDAVTVQDIIRVLTSNADKAKALVARLARDFPREHEPCPIGSDRALDTALITAPEARDPELLKKLDAVAGRVLRG